MGIGMKLVAVMAIAAASGLSGITGASAKPALPAYTSSGSCDVADLTVAAYLCFGTVLPEPVNDSASLLNTATFGGSLGLFGYTGWDNLARYTPADAKNGTPSSVSGSIGLDLTLSVVAGIATGDWSVTKGVFDMYKQIVIVLKQSSTFSAYLYDVTKGGAPIPESGSWSSAAFDPSSGLSHMTIYGGEICAEKYCGEDFNNNGGDDDTSPVPLPATGLLLVGGLSVLGAMKRRRKA